ncbi:MAG: hypothetical protein AAGG38_04340 [Planctomycetota bacterium]
MPDTVIPQSTPARSGSLTVAIRLAREAVRGWRGVRGLSKAALNLEPVDESVLRERRRACVACPAATRTKKLGLYPLEVLTASSACSVCRCNLYAKTRVASEACPRHHWHEAAGG